MTPQKVVNSVWNERNYILGELILYIIEIKILRTKYINVHVYNFQDYKHNIYKEFLMETVWGSEGSSYKRHS